MKWRSQIAFSKLDIANCDFKQNSRSGTYKLEITNCDIKSGNHRL